MRNNRKRRVLPACAILPALLIACVRDGNTDFSERYPAYFKYCFGDDAVCQFVEIEDDIAHQYRIVYSDKNGSEQSAPYRIAPYDKEDTADFQTAKEYYDAALEAVVLEALTDAIEADLTEQLLKKHFPEIETDGGIHIGDEAKLSVLALCNVWSGNAFGLNRTDALGARLSAEHLQPVTGWQLCNVSWETYAADPQWSFTVSLTLSADADADAYLQRFEAVYADYRAVSELPQTCTFSLRQTAEDAEETTALLWRRAVVFGEEIDMAAQDAGYSVWRAIEEQLRAYYAEQGSGET